jgi:hypothetical protein
VLLPTYKRFFSTLGLLPREEDCANVNEPLRRHVIKINICFRVLSALVLKSFGLSTYLTKQPVPLFSCSCRIGLALWMTLSPELIRHIAACLLSLLATVCGYVDM